jgi:hypothetical protein
MKRVLYPSLLMVLLAAIGSAAAAPQVIDGIPGAAATTAEFSQGTSMTPHRTQAESQFVALHSIWLAEVVQQAAQSSDPEHQVAAAVIAVSPGLLRLPVDRGFLDDLFASAQAAATLRPDLLAVLEAFCSAARDPMIWLDHDDPRLVPTVCADVDLAARASDLEPANAFHWVRRSGHALVHGDRHEARAHLLATARSSYWRPPYRTRMAVLLRTFSRWPPDSALAEAGALVEAESLLHQDPDAMARVFMGAWRDTVLFSALQAQNLAALTLEIGQSSAFTLCRKAIESDDKALLATCRRLARMWVDEGDTIVDVLAGYRLQILTETPAASARAEQELAEFREHHYSAYWRALREYDIEPDILTDIHNLIDHGEIEMMRRGLARVEAQVAADPDRHRHASGQAVIIDTKEVDVP